MSTPPELTTMRQQALTLFRQDLSLDDLEELRQEWLSILETLQQQSVADSWSRQVAQLQQNLLAIAAFPAGRVSLFLSAEGHRKQAQERLITAMEPLLH